MLNLHSILWELQSQQIQESRQDDWHCLAFPTSLPVRYPSFTPNTLNQRKPNISQYSWLWSMGTLDQQHPHHWDTYHSLEIQILEAHPTLTATKLWAWRIEQRFYQTFQAAQKHDTHQEPLPKVNSHLNRQCATRKQSWKKWKLKKSERSSWYSALL